MQITRYIQKIGIIAALALVVGLVAVPAPAAVAQSTAAKKAACESTGGTWSGTSCSETQSKTAIDTTIANIINIFSTVVGIIAVIMIIYGGFKFVTSAGDANNIKTAKSAITYAIVGLIIVALAQVIVRFVLNKSTEG